MKTTVLCIGMMICINLYSQENIKLLTKTITKNVPSWLKIDEVQGAQVLLIQKGKIIYDKAFGYADEIKKIKVRTQTPFAVASISKTFTAWAVLKLAQDKVINIDSPVNNYLHSWKLVSDKFDVSLVTPRRLMNHTAGMNIRSAYYYLPGESVPSLKQEILSGKGNMPGLQLRSKPGAAWNYSAGNYELLQFLVEEVSGMRFEDFMQKNIFGPLKMHSASFEKIAPNLAKNYDFNLKEIPREVYVAEGAASLRLSAEDLAKFIIAGYNNTILSKSVLDSAFSPQAETNNSFTLGYFYEKQANQPGIVGHDGGSPGCRAIFKYVPSSGDGIIILTNSSYGTSLQNQILCQWYQTLFSFQNNSYCNAVSTTTNTILKKIYTEGVENAVILYNEEKTKIKNLAMPDFYLSYWAYEMHARNFDKDAVLLLQFDTQINPDVANAWDSLGELSLAAGNKELAKQAYKKLLNLDPNNQNAIKQLKQLNSD